MSKQKCNLTGSKSDVAVEDCRPSLFDLFSERPDSMIFRASSSVVLFCSHGVKSTVSAKDIGDFLTYLGGNDCCFELFGDTYNLYLRGDYYIVNRNDAISSSDSATRLNEEVSKFVRGTTCGGGLSFFGSSTPLMIQPLITKMMVAADDSVCKVFKQDNHYVVELSLSCGDVVRVDLKTPALVVDYLKVASTQIIFIEAYSGVSIIAGALELARLGKSVIYVQLGFSSAYAIYNAMKEVDKTVLSSLVSCAFYFDFLPAIDFRSCPQIVFGDHPAFARWNELKVSPMKGDFVCKDLSDASQMVSLGKLWLMESLETDKDLIKDIEKGKSPIDIIMRLRMGGWNSIADDAACAARDKLVTFDSVNKNITMV